MAINRLHRLIDLHRLIGCYRLIDLHRLIECYRSIEFYRYILFPPFAKKYFHNCNFLFLAFNYSGGYFNPALATSLKYGCLGTSVMEHVIVYWVGACAGSIASIRVYQHPIIQNFIKKQKHKLH